MIGLSDIETSEKTSNEMGNLNSTTNNSQGFLRVTRIV